MKTDNQPFETVISVAKVSKDFVLPHERSHSVKQAFTGLFRSRDRRVEVQHALAGINFEIKKGEFFGIVGRNGSGKSTLLKLLAGIYQPTKGQVSIKGKLVPFIELGVGFNPELTGRENVHLNCALLGFSPIEVNEMYDDIVSFAELERFMDQKLKNYSSGMQVRLAFSVAITAQADILLVDEVLAVGDADFQRKCFEYFRSLKKQKKTVVFVTHDMAAVREYCDRAILIDRSKLVLEGSAEKVAEQYTKLFSEEATEDESQRKVSGSRWGDGRAKVEKISLSEKRLTPSESNLTITTQIKAYEDIESPIVGFSVKDSADNMLFGTNTRIKKQRLNDLKKGQIVDVTWTVPNIFADGRHYVNVSVEHVDGITVSDWWVEAASFIVRNDEQTAYSITPPIQVAISDKD
ncbi:MAG TPA: ABC transporter ATP-binding protein [Candidatus Saccharimonadales bacterium]